MKSFIGSDPGGAREWVLVDAADKPLGRLAVAVSNVLRGKHRPTFTPHVDGGDFVVVINAAKVKLTGRKEQQKIYQRFTGFRDGRKTMTAEQMRARHPENMLRFAVQGMLPGNRLSHRIMRRLRICAGGEHPYQAQKPKAVELL
jgi:large subunit ribosomal protein L13